MIQKWYLIFSDSARRSGKGHIDISILGSQFRTESYLYSGYSVQIIALLVFSAIPSVKEQAYWLERRVFLSSLTQPCRIIVLVEA